MTVISNHFAVLQVLLPFFAALGAALTRSSIARFIAITAASSSFILSIYGFSILNNSVSYHLGDFKPPYGIEYRLDALNQPLIIFINGVLLFLLIFCHGLVNSTIMGYISKNRQNLFYSILLFAHAGYIGIMSTNDIFNLYVFIEISSLSSYVLMAQGNNKKAAIGAFDYLVLGTIGATLILISIGFLFSYTGSLNMTDINKHLHGNYSSKIVITGISFFLIGSLLKTSFFPMHFWMVRSYLSAPSVILVYLAGISSIVGIYTFLRFIHFVINYNEVIKIISIFLKPIAFTTLIICSLLALMSKTMKKIVIYSSATQIGYIFLLIALQGAEGILLQLLLIDSLNKIALFFIIANIEDPTTMLIPKIGYKFYSFLIAIILICASGLPLSAMFIIKLNILDLLIKKNLWLDFAIIIISSAISLLYYYKIAIILFTDKQAKIKVIQSNCYGLTFIVLLQLISLIYYGVI